MKKAGEKLKVYLAIGNQEIEEIIEEGPFEVVDQEDSLDSLEDILEYASIDALIINRLLDQEGNTILKISRRAKKKGIKVLVLTDSFKDYEEQKYITKLVHEGVTAFISFEDLTTDNVEEVLFNYPKTFDFGVFTQIEEIKARRNFSKEAIVKSVFKEVIAIYSPLSHGTSTVASHLAMAIAESKNCRVCIVDFNPLKPSFKKIFDTDFEYTLVDALDGVVRKNLTYERLESYTKPSKYQKNLDILPGIYDINEYYSSNREQFEEIIVKLKFNYDYVIVDTHSWYDVLTTDVALRMADRVIVPVRGNGHDVDELNRYLRGFETYRDFDLRKFKIVINQYSGDDLTFVELESKMAGKILGYISKKTVYEKDNGFKDRRVMNEYVEILNGIGIDAKPKRDLKESLSNLFKFRKSS